MERERNKRMMGKNKSWSQIALSLDGMLLPQARMCLCFIVAQMTLMRKISK
jgi:hypothetical protein